MPEGSEYVYQLIGCAAAMGSAASWAVGSLLFQKVGEIAPPVGMNLGKCILGSFLLLVAVSLTTGFEPMDARTVGVLVVSGVLGIALGDSFFFKALVSLGPRLTVLLGTLGPVFTIVLSIVIFKESFSGVAWLGAALTLGGVNAVLLSEAPVDPDLKVEWKTGVVYSILAGLCMSLGILTAKVGVEQISALQGTLIRVVVAGLVLSVWGLGTRNLKAWLSPFKDPANMGLIIVSVSVVMFGGFWLSVLALKYISASLATVLNSTEPIFVIPLVALFLKERITFRAVAGAVVAVAGVVLILNF